jgi:hypothetical protein
VPDVYSLYIDDSGTRAPDHVVKTVPGKHDWFALGGILLLEQDKDRIEAGHAAFYSRWPQLKPGVPLHSSDIRMMKAGFSFLATDNELRTKFLGELGAFLTALPVLTHACVIDRAGYRARYAKSYGDEKWLYCKTAFSVLLERTVKFVRAKNARLRVHVEETAKAPDALIRDYYLSLGREGMPFTRETSEKYAPLSAQDFRDTLYGLKMKRKTSAVMQLADVYLWPMCKAAYAQNAAWVALNESKRLIDCVLEPHEVAHLGIKYSCFDAAPPMNRH